ncbi:hypothetical protein Tco_1265941 [Tanacetum coccineum]
MPTEMELTLEQTQQGVSYEVSVIEESIAWSGIGLFLFQSFDESNTYVLERFNTTAGNPVKKILLKLNLSDHRVASPKMGKVTDGRDCAWFDDLKDAQDHNVKIQVQEQLNPEVNDHYQHIHILRESQEYELKTKDKA